MTFPLNLLCRTICATVSLTVLGCCSYPLTRTFGVADNFSLSSADPIPYTPALPQFVTFLNTNGIPTADMTTFDNQTPNLHMVATLRHGLRSCFAGAIGLELCFHANAVASLASNDSVVIYDTDLTTSTFQVIFSSFIAPPLIATWNQGAISTLCIDLTQQMTNVQIGDMLQFRVQDDTAVDYIEMRLY